MSPKYRVLGTGAEVPIAAGCSYYRDSGPGIIEF